MKQDSPPEEAAPGGARPKRNVRLFRIASLSFFTLVAIVGSIIILIRQERLVVEAPDEAAGGGAAIRWQDAPIYLEEPEHETSGHRYLYHPVYGWKNIPNWSFTTHGKNLNINSRGLRDPERSLKKPTDTKRILVLGDSFVWGFGVDDDEIFTRELEQRLASRPRPWEVINTGVSGWGNDQQLLFLIEEGLAYEPDIVVLSFFFINDPINNSEAVQYGFNKPVFLNHQLELGNIPVPKPGEKPAELKLPESPWEITLAIMKGMSDVCRENDCRLVIMKFGVFALPDNPDVRERDRKWNQDVARLSGIDYLDLDAEFTARGLAEKDLTSKVIDRHWTPAGHEIIAKLLHEFLEEKQLIQ